MKSSPLLWMASAITAFLSLSGFVLVVSRQPLQGYELNIYAHVPALGWIFFGLSILMAMLLILKAVFLDEVSWMRWGATGFLLLYLSMFSLVMLPVIRGYFFYGRGDGLSHLGFVQNTLAQGHFASDDIYPAREIILASLDMFSMLSPRFIELSAPGLGPLLGMPFFYLLARLILGSSRRALLAMLILSTATLGITNSRFAPQDLGNLLTVLFLVSYLRFRWENGANGRTILVLMGLALPIIHPFTATIIILSLVAMEIVLAVFRYRPQPSRLVSTPTTSISLGLATMITVAYLLWNIYHTYLLGALAGTVQYMLGAGVAQSLFEEMADTMTKYQINPYLIGIKMYGHIFYYGILALIGVIIFARRVSLQDTEDRNKLMLLVFVAIPLSITVLQTFIQVWRINPGRPAVLVEIAFPSFVAVALTHILGRKVRLPLTKKSAVALGVLVILLLAPAISVVMYDAHLTPLRQWPGDQVSRQEYSGLGWFFARRDNIGIKEVGIRHFRFAILYPNAVASGWYGSPELEVKDHFGYDFFVEMGEGFERDSYVLTSEYDWQVYTVLFPHINRFTTSDFHKLDDDPSVLKLYSAGGREMEVRYVKASARY